MEMIRIRSYCNALLICDSQENPKLSPNRIPLSQQLIIKKYGHDLPSELIINKSPERILKADELIFRRSSEVWIKGEIDILLTLSTRDNIPSYYTQWSKSQSPSELEIEKKGYASKGIKIKVSDTKKK